jgi:4-hydroxy-L-threonine phosphate dehydrogenase PdxA
MEKYMKEYEELLDKTEDVIIKPIKLSAMKEAGIKFSGSMTILRNVFIIKDK